MKAKYLLIILLLVITVLILTPPLRYGYIYPTAGDDTAEHTIYFKHMDEPVGSYYTGHQSPRYPLYGGQYIVGVFMRSLPFDINISFTWFHFAILIMVVWVIGFTVALSVNYYAGILASILVFGRSYLLTQFCWGVIFDIIGIGILLPVLLLCLHNIDKGKWWKVGAGLSFIFFSGFHVNGKYLFALVPIVIAIELFRYYISRRNQQLADKIGKYRFLLYTWFLFLALILAYALGISVDPTRIFLDSSILLLITFAGIMSLLVVHNWKFAVAMVVLAVVASYPQMQYWMKDNSALKMADKEAIALVNSFEPGEYTLSSEITRNIYGLYIKQEWVDIGGDYLITRSIAMTETSAIALKHNEKELSIDDYELVKVFSNGERDNVSGELIEVSVYVKSH